MASTTCARCNRGLKDVVSVQAGLGPVCRAIAGRSDSGRLLDDQPVLNDVAPLREVGLVCRRLADGRLACNVPQVVKYHSPTGFECGYGGSGPADLALNVLHQLLPPARQCTDQPIGRKCGDVVVSDEAAYLHQEFKARFIATMPKEGGCVPIEVINEWLAERLVAEAA